VRNPTLHGLLEAFTTDAGTRLQVATAAGDEIPFELVQDDSGRVPLYCYRPLTSSFIRAHVGLLAALPTYAPAARALEHADGTGTYLRARGEAHVPTGPRERADATLRCFLARVFEERSEFVFDADRFGRSFDELERSLYDGRSVTEVVAHLLGVALDPGTAELPIAEGLVMMRPELVSTPPPDADWAVAGGHRGKRGERGERGPAAAGVLLVLRTTDDGAGPAPVALARRRFRRVLTALRLFESGAFAIGPIGFARVDDGEWLPVALGTSGRSGLPTPISAGQEDELRAFCNLIGRRLPGRAPESSGAGELAWALARFELGCERIAPFEALTDYLLALRALLEPEGPSSGRLAQRLAVICAPSEGRRALAERVAHAISLERAVIAGLAPAGPGAGELVGELADHLRAILRDVLCGHLDADVRAVADELLAEAAGRPV
jgi:hypothetical protein